MRTVTERSLATNRSGLPSEPPPPESGDGNEPIKIYRGPWGDHRVFGDELRVLVEMIKADRGEAGVYELPARDCPKCHGIGTLVPMAERVERTFYPGSLRPLDTFITPAVCETCDLTIPNDGPVNIRWDHKVDPNAITNAAWKSRFKGRPRGSLVGGADVLYSAPNVPNTIIEDPPSTTRRS